MSQPFILTLSCQERPGIVHAVTAFLFENGCDIVEHQQFDDAAPRARCSCAPRSSAPSETDAERLSAAFRAVAERVLHGLPHHRRQPERVLVMVSKMGHCLNDLIFRWRAGNLGGELVAVVSNHEDLRPMAEAAGLPFHHVPVTRRPSRRPRRGCSSWWRSTAPISWCWRATCRCSRTSCA